MFSLKYPMVIFPFLSGVWKAWLSMSMLQTLLFSNIFSLILPKIITQCELICCHILLLIIKVISKVSNSPPLTYTKIPHLLNVQGLTYFNAYELALAPDTNCLLFYFYLSFNLHISSPSGLYTMGWSHTIMQYLVYLIRYNTLCASSYLSTNFLSMGSTWWLSN